MTTEALLSRLQQLSDDVYAAADEMPPGTIGSLDTEVFTQNLPENRQSVSFTITNTPLSMDEEQTQCTFSFVIEEAGITHIRAETGGGLEKKEDLPMSEGSVDQLMSMIRQWVQDNIPATLP